MKRKTTNAVSSCLLIVFGLCGITLIVGNVLLSSNSFADNDPIVDQVNVTVSESCTLAGVGMDSHVATLHNDEYSGHSGSSYVNGIGKTTLTAFCNDYNGFSIYAIGFTGDSYTGTNHTKLVGVADNTLTISTGLYSSGDTTSSWAMKVDKVTDGTVAYIPANMSIQNSFDSWHAVPDTYTKVAQYHANSGSSATDTVLGGKLETTYQAYVSVTQAADTYEGKVKYTLVHPYDEEPAQPQTTASGKICYYANASTAEGTMGCQDVASSVTLLASNFSRTGYGFAGWSDKFDYASNAEAHFYGPQEDLSISDTSIYTGEGKGLSLYAVWVKPQGNLQDASKVSSVCSGLTIAPTDGTANLSSVSALTDQRDNETYAIAKLADGKCWMIENLRLESTNSDNSTGALAQGYGTSATYGNFSGLADPEAPWTNNSTTANSLYSTNGADNTINIGTSDAGYRFPRYNNYNNQSTSANRPDSPTTNSATNSTTNAGMYSYGNYYTWHAAIADTTAYSSGDHNTTSICPTGWQIPLGYTSTGDIEQGANDSANKVPGFSYLDRKMGGTGQTAQSTTADSLRWRKYPVNFVYSGYVYSGSVYSRGSGGNYWSSTVHSSGDAYHLYLNSSYVGPGTNNSYKYVGRTIRCVAPGA